MVIYGCTAFWKVDLEDVQRADGPDNLQETVYLDH